MLSMMLFITCSHEDILNLYFIYLTQYYSFIIASIIDSFVMLPV